MENKPFKASGKKTRVVVIKPGYTINIHANASLGFLRSGAGEGLIMPMDSLVC